MRGNVKYDEKVCGGCAFFHSEDTGGWGFCAVHRGELGEFMHCSDMCEDDYVGREEMRHHMAVLLQYQRWLNSTVDVNIIRPSLEDIDKSQTFAYKYMKVFSKL